jgi:membrane protein required for colicin V production
MVVGLWRGLVKEALSLAFWIGAVIAAGLFYPQAAQWLSRYLSNPVLQQVAGFVLIFIGVILVGSLLSSLLSKLFSAVGLAATDRALGGLFGIVRGVVIVTVIVMLTRQLPPAQQFYQESVVMPYIELCANYLQEWFDLALDKTGEQAPVIPVEDAATAV